MSKRPTSWSSEIAGFSLTCLDSDNDFQEIPVRYSRPDIPVHSYVKSARSHNFNFNTFQFPISELFPAIGASFSCPRYLEDHQF